MRMTSPAPELGSPDGYRWLVSEDSAGVFPIRTGTTESLAAAWTAAFAVGRDALLEGRIRFLAIAVDDEIPALGYSPGRDRLGRLDPEHVVAYLEGLLHDTLSHLPPDRPGRWVPAVCLSGEVGSATRSVDRAVNASDRPRDYGGGDESEFAGTV